MRRTTVYYSSSLETLHTSLTETKIAATWTKSLKLVGAAWILRRTPLPEGPEEEGTCRRNSYQPNVFTIVFLCPEFIGE
jgi:hypothetical protein